MVLDGQKGHKKHKDPSKQSPPYHQHLIHSPSPNACFPLLVVDWPAKISLALPNFGSDPSAGQITGASQFGSALHGEKPNEPLVRIRQCFYAHEDDRFQIVFGTFNY
jgi:hypothetical protein